MDLALAIGLYHLPLVNASTSYARNEFFALFDETPASVRSPGRINLIGEHTDDNDGCVLPAAVNKEIVLAIASAISKKCTILARDLDETFEFDCSNGKQNNPGQITFSAFSLSLRKEGA